MAKKNTLTHASAKDEDIKILTRQILWFMYGVGNDRLSPTQRERVRNLISYYDNVYGGISKRELKQSYERCNSCGQEIREVIR